MTRLVLYLATLFLFSSKLSDACTFDTPAFVFEYAPAGTIVLPIDPEGQTVSLIDQNDFNGWFEVSSSRDLVVKEGANITRGDPLYGKLMCGTSTKDVVILIEKTNMNPPRIETNPTSPISVEESQAVGTIITQVTLIDDDVEASDIVLELVDSNPPDYFILDGTRIRVNKSLSLDEPSASTDYTITLMAISYGYNSLGETWNQTTTASIDVNVEDVDNNPFIFNGCHTYGITCVPPLYTTTVTTSNTTVESIDPQNIGTTDLDPTVSSVEYSFVGGDPASYDTYFAIDLSSGDVSAKQDIPSDFSSSQFNIVVQARQIDTDLFIYANLIINVEQLDDYPPELVNPPAMAYMPTDTLPGVPTFLTADENGEQRLQLSAIDQDDPDGSFIYEIASPYQVSSDGLVFYVPTTKAVPGNIVVTVVNLNADPNSANRKSEQTTIQVLEVISTTTMESTTMESTTMESTTMESTTMESTTMESTTMESTTMESTTMESTTKESTTVAPTTMASTTMESTTMESTTMEPTTMESTTMESTTMEPTTKESTTMESTTMEPTTMASTTMASTTMESTTMESTTMESTTMEPTTMEPNTNMTAMTPLITTGTTSTTLVTTTLPIVTDNGSSTLVTNTVEESTTTSIVSTTESDVSPTSIQYTTAQTSISSESTSSDSSVTSPASSNNTTDHTLSTLISNQTVPSTTAETTKPVDIDTTTKPITTTTGGNVIIPGQVSEKTLYAVAGGLGAALAICIIIIILLIYKLQKKKQKKDKKLLNETPTNGSPSTTNYVNTAFIENETSKLSVDGNSDNEGTVSNYDKESVSNTAVISKENVVTPQEDDSGTEVNDYEDLNKSESDDSISISNPVPDPVATPIIVLPEADYSLAKDDDDKEEDEDELTAGVKMDPLYSSIPDIVVEEESEPTTSFANELIAGAAALKVIKDNKDLDDTNTLPTDGIQDYGTAYQNGQIITHKVLKTGKFNETSLITIPKYGKEKKDERSIVKKLMKDEATSMDISSRQAEIRLLKKANEQEHLNLVGFYGVYENSNELHMATMFCENGNLDSYLVSHSRDNIDPHQLMLIITGVGKGLQYLHAKNIVHCHLQSRCILLDSNMNARIRNFENNEISVVRENDDRMRWQALEVLNGDLSSPASDIWSFGVLKWEIASLGVSPYSNLKITEIKQYLNDGNRLTTPIGCSEKLFMLMESCWNAEPRFRPDIYVINTHISDMLTEDSNELICMDVKAEKISSNEIELDFPPPPDKPFSPESGDEDFTAF